MTDLPIVTGPCRKALDSGTLTDYREYKEDLVKWLSNLPLLWLCLEVKSSLEMQLE